jgi:hypothetical protein
LPLNSDKTRAIFAREDRTDRKQQETWRVARRIDVGRKDRRVRLTRASL